MGRGEGCGKSETDSTVVVVKEQRRSEEPEPEPEPESADEIVDLPGTLTPPAISTPPTTLHKISEVKVSVDVERHKEPAAEAEKKELAPMELRGHIVDHNTRIVLIAAHVAGLLQDASLFKFTEVDVGAKCTIRDKPTHLEEWPLYREGSSIESSTWLLQSRAIARYLLVLGCDDIDQVRNKHQVIYFDSDPKTRALIDYAVEFEQNHLSPWISCYLANKAYPGTGLEGDHKEDQDPDNNFLDEIELELGHIEQLFFKQDSTHIVGMDSASLADYSMFVTIDQLCQTTKFDLAKYPKIRAWYKLMKQDKIVQAVCKDFWEHPILAEVAEKYSQLHPAVANLNEFDGEKKNIDSSTSSTSSPYAQQSKGLLHGLPLSNHYRSAAITAEMLGLFADGTMQPKRVDIAKGAHQTDQFRTLNPKCQIPSYTEGPYILNESRAICRYFCYMSDSAVARQLLPDPFSQPRLYAQVECLLAADATFIAPNISNYVFNKCFAKGLGAPIRTDKMDAALEELPSVFEYLEENYFESSPFCLVGTEYTLADMSIFATMDQLLSSYAEFKPPPCPKVEKWYQHMKTDPSVMHICQPFWVMMKLMTRFAGQVTAKKEEQLVMAAQQTITEEHYREQNAVSSSSSSSSSLSTSASSSSSSSFGETDEKIAKIDLEQYTCSPDGQRCDCLIPAHGSIRGPLSIDITDEPIYICRCGLSTKFPLCDGSHLSLAPDQKSVGEQDEDEDEDYESVNKPLPLSMADFEGKDSFRALLCTCGHARHVFCDCSHSQLRKISSKSNKP